MARGRSLKAMTLTPTELNESPDPRWFCLKAQPKHEHLAAAALQQLHRVDCFVPRIRYRKSTTRGVVWFVEPMFPGYLLARFIYRDLHRAVQHAPGVTAIVRFGDRIAVIDDAALEPLRESIGADQLVVFDPEVRLGDTIKIAEGAFLGLEAVVTQLLPAKERVKVLIDFLGRPVETEIHRNKVLPKDGRRV